MARLVEEWYRGSSGFIRRGRGVAGQSVAPVVTYTAPGAQYQSSTYTVSVNGSPAWVYPTSGGDHIVKFDSTYAGSVSVTITTAADITTSAYVGPASKSVTPTRGTRTVTFNVPGPGRYPVVVDDNWAAPLVVIANPMLINPPTASTSTLTYIGPGVYSTDLLLPGTKDVFVHGGALCASGFQVGTASPTAARVAGGKVWGRGIVDSTLRTGAAGPGRALRYYNVDGGTVEGLTFISNTNWCTAIYQSNNVNASWCDAFSYRLNNAGTPDGWDHIGSSDCTFSDGFIKSYDDGMAMKCEKNGYAGPCQRNTVSRVVLIQGDGGNALEHGYEVSSAGADVSDILWEDIDVVRKTTRTTDTYRRSATGVHNPGPGAIRRITFRRVRVESSMENDAMVSSFATTDYPSSTRGIIDDVLFDSCSWPGAAPMVVNADSSGDVTNVRFISCLRAGIALSASGITRTNTSSNVAVA